MNPSVDYLSGFTLGTFFGMIVMALIAYVYLYAVSHRAKRKHRGLVAELHRRCGRGVVVQGRFPGGAA
jgi:hypothetical protein